MAAASICRNVDIVRRLAAELRLNSPKRRLFIDENRGLINLRFREDYEYRYHFAQRIAGDARVAEPTFIVLITRSMSVKSWSLTPSD